MLLKVKGNIEKKVRNLSQQGKSEKEIKQAVSIYLTQIKNKINPNGDLDSV